MDTVIESPASDATITPEPAAPEATPTPTDVTPAGGEPGGEITPTFTPNYKVKVMDKEHEIPEQFRSIIKDAESEKLAREIFEKAYGLDHVKPKYESLKTQYEQINNEYTPIKKDLEILGQLIESKDVGGVMSALGLTDEQLIKHAMERIEYHQLSPEKKQQVDQQRSQSLKYYRTEQELNDLKNQKAQEELGNTYNELVSNVRAPHIQAIAESFNTRAGKPEAFEQAVIAHAQAHFALTKQDLSVPQAIESFIRTFGLQAASQQASPAPAAPASATPGQRPSTLPKSGAGTVSPVKPKVSSIADLRKLQQQSYES
jgi:hypothetical protein